MSLNPKIWGPHAWIFLHSVTLSYPNNPSDLDKKTFKYFFLNLKDILPCQKCRYNYRNHLQKYNIDDYLNNREDLVKWLIMIHNEVNISNNEKIYSYDDVIDYYKNLYNNNNNNIYLFIIIIVIIILFGLSFLF